jgi:hypothetical protein
MESMKIWDKAESPVSTFTAGNNATGYIASPVSFTLVNSLLSASMTLAVNKKL